MHRYPTVTMTQHELEGHALNQPNSSSEVPQTQSNKRENENEPPPKSPIAPISSPSLSLIRRTQLPQSNIPGTTSDQPQTPTMTSLSTSPAVTELGKKLDELEISFNITTAMGYFSTQHLDKAKREIRNAYKIATAKGYKIHALRCRYWSGRIEFDRKNFVAAHRHFTAALPCLIYDEYPEGDDLMLYLRLSQPGVSDSLRKRILQQQCQAIFKERPSSIRFKQRDEVKHPRTQTPGEESQDFALHPPKKRPPNSTRESDDSYNGNLE